MSFIILALYQFCLVFFIPAVYGMATEEIQTNNIVGMNVYEFFDAFSHHSRHKDFQQACLMLSLPETRQQAMGNLVRLATCEDPHPLAQYILGCESLEKLQVSNAKYYLNQSSYPPAQALFAHLTLNYPERGSIKEQRIAIAKGALEKATRPFILSNRECVYVPALFELFKIHYYDENNRLAAYETALKGVSLSEVLTPAESQFWKECVALTRPDDAKDEEEAFFVKWEKAPHTEKEQQITDQKGHDSRSEEQDRRIEIYKEFSQDFQDLFHDHKKKKIKGLRNLLAKDVLCDESDKKLIEEAIDKCTLQQQIKLLLPYIHSKNRDLIADEYGQPVLTLAKVQSGEASIVRYEQIKWQARNIILQKIVSNFRSSQNQSIESCLSLFLIYTNINTFLPNTLNGLNFLDHVKHIAKGFYAKKVLLDLAEKRLKKLSKEHVCYAFALADFYWTLKKSFNDAFHIYLKIIKTEDCKEYKKKALDQLLKISDISLTREQIDLMKQEIGSLPDSSYLVTLGQFFLNTRHVSEGISCIEQAIQQKNSDALDVLWTYYQSHVLSAAEFGSLLGKIVKNTEFDTQQHFEQCINLILPYISGDSVRESYFLEQAVQSNTVILGRSQSWLSFIKLISSKNSQACLILARRANTIGRTSEAIEYYFNLLNMKNIDEQVVSDDLLVLSNQGNSFAKAVLGWFWLKKYGLDHEKKRDAIEKLLHSLSFNTSELMQSKTLRKVIEQITGYLQNKVKNNANLAAAQILYQWYNSWLDKPDLAKKYLKEAANLGDFSARYTMLKRSGDTSAFRLFKFLCDLQCVKCGQKESLVHQVMKDVDQESDSLMPFYKLIIRYNLFPEFFTDVFNVNQVPKITKQLPRELANQVEKALQKIDSISGRLKLAEYYIAHMAYSKAVQLYSEIDTTWDIAAQKEAFAGLYTCAKKDQEALKILLNKYHEVKKYSSELGFCLLDLFDLAKRYANTNLTFVDWLPISLENREFEQILEYISSDKAWQDIIIKYSSQKLSGQFAWWVKRVNIPVPIKSDKEELPKKIQSVQKDVKPTNSAKKNKHKKSKNQKEQRIIELNNSMQKVLKSLEQNISNNDFSAQFDAFHKEVQQIMNGYAELGDISIGEILLLNLLTENNCAYKLIVRAREEKNGKILYWLGRLFIKVAINESTNEQISDGISKMIESGCETLKEAGKYGVVPDEMMIQQLRTLILRYMGHPCIEQCFDFLDKSEYQELFSQHILGQNKQNVSQLFKIGGSNKYVAYYVASHLFKVLLTNNTYVEIVDMLGSVIQSRGMLLSDSLILAQFLKRYRARAELSIVQEENVQNVLHEILKRCDQELSDDSEDIHLRLLHYAIAENKEKLEQAVQCAQKSNNTLAYGNLAILFLGDPIGMFGVKQSRVISISQAENYLVKFLNFLHLQDDSEQSYFRYSLLGQVIDSLNMIVKLESSVRLSQQDSEAFVSCFFSFLRWHVSYYEKLTDALVQQQLKFVHDIINFAKTYNIEFDHDQEEYLSKLINSIAQYKNVNSILEHFAKTVGILGAYWHSFQKENNHFLNHSIRSYLNYFKKMNREQGKNETILSKNNNKQTDDSKFDEYKKDEILKEFLTFFDLYMQKKTSNKSKKEKLVIDLINNLKEYHPCSSYVFDLIVTLYIENKFNLFDNNLVAIKQGLNLIRSIYEAGSISARFGYWRLALIASKNGVDLNEYDKYLSRESIKQAAIVRGNYGALKVLQEYVANDPCWSKILFEDYKKFVTAKEFDEAGRTVKVISYGGNQKEAFKMLTQEMTKSSSVASIYKSYMYLFGCGTEKSLESALKYLMPVLSSSLIAENSTSFDNLWNEIGYSGIIQKLKEELPLQKNVQLIDQICLVLSMYWVKSIGLILAIERKMNLNDIKTLQTQLDNVQHTLDLLSTSTNAEMKAKAACLNHILQFTRNKKFESLQEVVDGLVDLLSNPERGSLIWKIPYFRFAICQVVTYLAKHVQKDDDQWAKLSSKLEGALLALDILQITDGTSSENYMRQEK